MRPSDQGVEKFRLIYKELYGEKIGTCAAREMATRVLTLYELLARPLPEKTESKDTTDDDAK